MSPIVNPEFGEDKQRPAMAEKDIKANDQKETVKPGEAPSKKSKEMIMAEREAKKAEKSARRAAVLEAKDSKTEATHATDAKPDGKDGSTPEACLLYTSPSPRDRQKSRMPSSA